MIFDSYSAKILIIYFILIVLYLFIINNINEMNTKINYWFFMLTFFVVVVFEQQPNKLVYLSGWDYNFVNSLIWFFSKLILTWQNWKCLIHENNQIDYMPVVYLSNL